MPSGDLLPGTEETAVPGARILPEKNAMPWEFPRKPGDFPWIYDDLWILSYKQGGHFSDS